MKGIILRWHKSRKDIVPFLTKLIIFTNDTEVLSEIIKLFQNIMINDTIFTKASGCSVSVNFIIFLIIFFLLMLFSLELV